MARARRAPFAVFWAVMFLHVVARAEPTAAERVVAREQFEQGVSLEASGDWEGALARFTDVARVVSTPNVHYHLGLCLERTSRLVRALDELARSVAQQNLATNPDPVMMKSAEEHIASLRRRIPLVELRLPADVPATSPLVSIDDETLTVLPRQIPLDPGTHHIVVRLAGRPTFETRITLAERQSAVVDVVFGAPPSSAPPTDVPPDSEPARSHPLRGWGYVAAGTSIAAGVAGITMYLVRGSVVSELDGACGDARSSCPPSKRDLAERGDTYTTLGNAFVGVAALSAVSAAVLFLLDARSPPPPQARLPRVDIAVGTAGAPGALTLRGRF